MGATITLPPRYPTTRARVKTGTYVGNGVDNRNINIGVNLSAATNPHVMIKDAGSSYSVGRIEYSQGDLTMKLGASGADSANEIQSFTTTGFQVGTANTVNLNGTTFRYVAHWEETV